MKVGVLALQGAVVEHRRALEAIEVEPVEVKKVSQLEGLDGLIIPGGESTTIGQLMEEYDFFEPLQSLGRQGFPLYGTCAGLILLAKEIEGSSQPRLGLMDIAVRRNAFGRQRESFEVPLAIPVLGDEPFQAVFIRAPYISYIGESVQELARLQDKIVMARQQNLLVSAFHPELTDDFRIHRYFRELIKGNV